MKLFAYMTALAAGFAIDTKNYMLLNALNGKGLNMNDPFVMASMFDGDLFGDADGKLDFTKLMLFGGNMNLQNNPMLMLNLLNGGDMTEYSKPGLKIS